MGESKPLEKHSNDHNVQPGRQPVVPEPTQEEYVLFALDVERPSIMDPLNDDLSAQAADRSPEALETSGDSAWVRMYRGLLTSKRPSLSCNSDCTVNVRQPSMSRNSNLTICLGSQRASLSCNSDCTVNVWQPRLRSSSDCTVKFSMSCNSDAPVCIPQEWDVLRKSSDVVCYDERLSLRTCASIGLSENKDLSDEQVGVIDKILLNLSPDGHEENRQRMSHYCYGSGTLTHRRKTYSPSSDGHRSRFA